VTDAEWQSHHLFSEERAAEGHSRCPPFRQNATDFRWSGIPTTASSNLRHRDAALAEVRLRASHRRLPSGLVGPRQRALHCPPVAATPARIRGQRRWWEVCSDGARRFVNLWRRRALVGDGRGMRAGSCAAFGDGGVSGCVNGGAVTGTSSAAVTAHATRATAAERAVGSRRR